MSSSSDCVAWDWRERGILAGSVAEARRWLRASNVVLVSFRADRPRIELPNVYIGPKFFGVAGTSASEGAPELERKVRAELPARPNWDGEGSPGYTNQVIERAVRLFTEMARAAKREHIRIEMPDFGPGPDGSIDLYWDAEGYSILINVPADPRSQPTFYGDNKGATQIKGTLDETSPGLARLVLWLRGFA